MFVAKQWECCEVQALLPDEISSDQILTGSSHYHFVCVQKMVITSKCLCIVRIIK